jgi:hypothetical protein
MGRAAIYRHSKQKCFRILVAGLRVFCLRSPFHDVEWDFHVMFFFSKQPKWLCQTTTGRTAQPHNKERVRNPDCR